MNIKASDVYTKKQGHHCWWLAKNGKSLANFDNECDVDDLINAYDTNQARIAHYEKVVCSMCDGHGMVGNIIESMDCPECIQAANKDQARIAELEAEVKLLRGCNESPGVSPTITAGCYCTDIETEAQYIATCEALVKLGCLASGFYSYPDSGMCSYRDEYLINGNVGWVEPSMEISNGIYHAKGDLRHCFTTLVSHRDIIKAAEGL